MAGTEEGTYADLADALDALANEKRLELLHQLREPKSAKDILLSPSRVGEGENPDRPISRQAARGQLERLLASGLVLKRPGRRGAFVNEEYVLNHQRVFAVVEELRKLTRLAPILEIDGPTTDIGAPKSMPPAGGPVLILIHGADEGLTFPLAPPGDGSKDAPEWKIGRLRGLTVGLDYDPFVSGENCVVTPLPAGGYELRDLPMNRNGTFLNWKRLGPGGRARLRHGDVIGVGKSLLLFRE